MINSRWRVFVLIGLPLVIFGAWFSWMSFEQAPIQWMESKVKAALETSMESLAPKLPRIEVDDKSSGAVYYAPNVSDPFHSFDLYGNLLVLLNQDESVPTVKVTLVSMQTEYGSSVTTLMGQAKVEFPVFAWINQEIVVHSSIQVPHYKTSIGVP